MHDTFIFRPAYATDGVGAIPQEYNVPPEPRTPEITRCARIGLVVLVSIPSRTSEECTERADPVLRAIWRSS
jgi:hypothetical protein